jgi:tetratricopeptide (TPR) repeat protein
MAGRRRELWVAVLLVAATLAVYAQVAGFDFVNYDDPEYVTSNPWVRAGLTPIGFVWAFTAGHAGNWHPLTWLSHMLDVQLWGLRPGAHHLTNVVLHATSAVLLFLFLRGTTGALWPSAAVAALFALHPLHVESVAWISERKDVLSTLFFMLTLLAYSGWVRRPSPGRYLVALLLFALGLMAKPMLVTLPVLLLLLDVWPLARRRASWAALVREKIPFFALAAGSALMTFVAQLRYGAVATADTLPLATRAANAVVAGASYLGLAVYPAGLVLFYPHVPLPAWKVAGAGAVLVAISALVVRLAPKRPWLGVAWLWYVVTLLPVIGLIQVGDQAMADRFTYLPLVGPFFAVAWAAAEVAAARPAAGRAIAVAASAALVAFAVGSWRQVGYWRNSETLFTHAVAVIPDSYVANNNLGNALAGAGRLDEAMARYEAALRAKPDLWNAQNNIGVILAQQGRIADAIPHYTEAIRLNPEFADAYSNLGAALADQGRLDEAIASYTQAIRLKPDHPDAHANLANAFARQGKLDLAIQHYSEALRLNPDHVSARVNLGRVLAARGAAGGGPAVR